MDNSEETNIWHTYLSIINKLKDIKKKAIIGDRDYEIMIKKILIEPFAVKELLTPEEINIWEELPNYVKTELFSQHLNADKNKII